ncbi:MAG: hypothetical protein CVU11_14190 [Bacteroidetes bacterium HGW-Bacteroidetes-6]|jgi:predicted AlkP superfamily phosphohydrolase/phosphomutase/tetratricopeptide (TPR) repeat protein|nr:MAG: hypothetical protein CVU11_14190 [Bacteroidetes bacterium HGW-Bacteroidetes-6]
MAKKKVLVIGWDAADWKVINTLMDAGKMPALQKLVDTGVIGNIATLDPPLSPILWTSIATGKWGDKHGILGFVEPDVQNGFIRNINSTSRKTRAIWNILHHEGYKQNIVGWWPSHPAEPINGVMVSNFYQRANVKPGVKWQVPKGAVYPPEMVKEIAPLRIHPGELTEQHILPFIPNAANIDQKGDEFGKKTLNSLAQIVADTATIQSTATYLMENTEWDFMAVYFDGIDHFCHGFMKFYPPQLKGLPDDKFQMYQHVVSGGYIFHDMMLERLVELAGKDTTIIILSDHGFHSDHLRLKVLPKYNAAPALEHNPFGVFVINGPGIKRDERVYGATLLDVTPTILTVLGLPVGKDMDGKVLASIFEEEPKIDFIDSWDNIEGDFAEHPKHLIEDSYESAEALKQLIELGYIEDPGDDKMLAMKKTENEIKYNLAKIHLARRHFVQALPILEELYEYNPKDVRYSLDLANCYAVFKEFEKVRKVFDSFKNLSDDENENKKFLNIGLLEAKLLLAERRPFEAMEILNELKKKNPYNIKLVLELGNIYFDSGKYKEALDAYEFILKIDPNHALAYYGKAQIMLHKKQYEEAADNALNAIGFLYHFPKAHFLLGQSLVHLQYYEGAANAFELALEMSPKLFPARRWLIDIYEKHLNLPEKAEAHRKKIEDMTKGKITVVSGLPRSGTSMMMQMLNAGGLEVLTDKKREADNNNPKGYFELEKVKGMAKDNTWVIEAEGKVIKVIAQLLQHLPPEFEYDVIFMDRDMNEILRSQQVMLNRDPSTYPTMIANAFNKELEKVDVWSKNSPGVRLKHIKYKDVIENPVIVAAEINEFLDFRLDEQKMIEAVDPDLYRNKLS